MLIIFALIILLAWGAKQMAAPYDLGTPYPISLDPSHLPYYALRTILRLFIALIFSLIFTFTVGTLAAKNKHAERVIIPAIDILQSVPILSFLSITITAFIAIFRGSMLGPECAAIFAVFTSQVWNMTLSFYQSVRTVPTDLKEAAAVYRLSNWQRFWKVEVPYALPGLLWNMMMSMSGSWFFVTASEAFSVANQTITLPGIGSYITIAIAHANPHAVIYAIIAMLIVIFLYDQILFRPLVYWAEKFKPEQEEDVMTSRSVVVTIFQRSRLLKIFGEILSNLGGLMINARFLRKRNNNAIAVMREGENKKVAIVYYGALFTGLTIAGIIIARFILHTIPLLEIKDVFILGLYTAGRVLSLIIISSLIWVPIGVWIGLRPQITGIMQPIIQFLAAFPANLLFPVISIMFVRYHMNIQIWVAPLMILGTQWYILFNVVAGASVLPKDIKQASALFKVKGWLRWRRLLLPGIAPYYITGVITAAGGAWNASILAEVINWGDIKLHASGLGAYIAENFSKGDFPRIALGTIMMCLLVLIINRLIWRPIYNWAVDRYNI
jgi:NitT/TauT family transport system permease protein